MVIKLILLKKNLSQRFIPNTSARLRNAALSTSRRPMYVNKADFAKQKLILTISPLKRPLDLETQLYQLLEGLCMVINLISLKKHLSQRFIRNTSARLRNAALSTSRRPMYVNKADFVQEKLILTIFPQYVH